MHKAIQNNDIELVQKLIREGARVNQQESSTPWRDRPLHMAAGNNNVALIELLIDHGAYVDAQNKWQNTPINRAVLNNHTEAVAKLIEKGADVDRRTPGELPNEKGKTLLGIAQDMAKHYPEKDFSKIIKLIQSDRKLREKLILFSTISPLKLSFILRV